MSVAQLETPSCLKPGLQFCGNSFHSSPLERRCDFSIGLPVYLLRQVRVNGPKIQENEKASGEKASGKGPDKTEGQAQIAGMRRCAPSSAGPARTAWPA